MKEEMIKDIKVYIDERLKKQNEIKDLLMELEALKENPYVMRYIELYEKVGDNDDCYNESENNIINDAYYLYSGKNDKTNKIYFYLGTYKYSNECDINHESGTVLTFSYDPEAKFRKYRDLENDQIELEIPMKEAEEFEAKNKIIYCKYPFLSDMEYYDLSKKFFCDIIINGQENAVKKLLKKRAK